MKNETAKVVPKKVQRFVLYAIPCRKSFVVSREKAEEFKQQHNSSSDNEFVRRMAETFRKNNLVVDGPGPMLKKVRKSNSGKIIRK